LFFLGRGVVVLDNAHAVVQKFDIGRHAHLIRGRSSHGNERWRDVSIDGMRQC
jgi:hypothetical protein